MKTTDLLLRIISKQLEVQTELLYYLLPEDHLHKKSLRKYINDVYKILKEFDE